MINVLLDPLPTGYEDEESGTFYPMDFDFRVGIQLALLQNDPELEELEKILLTQDLIFTGARPDTPEKIKECVIFYTQGWYHDNEVKSRNENIRKSDFDVDQWRIYAAFRNQYNIDLNSIEELHYWVFMGLLSGLEECAYTRVIDIRTKKTPKGLKGDDLKAFRDAKNTYRLDAVRTKEMDEEHDYLYSEYFTDSSSVSEEEKKRIETMESFADK